MRSGGLTSAFGGNLAVMDIYAAQQVFGRGRRFDRIDVKLQNGLAVEAGQAAIRNALGVGFDVRAAGVARAAARIHAGGLCDLDEHLERLRAVHRHVHHLQLVFDCRHAAAIGNRHPARARRAAPADQKSLPHRKRRERSPGVARRHRPRHLHGARRWWGRSPNMLEGIYGVAERAEEVSADPRLLGAAIAIGISTSMIAAWLPARSASRVDPVQALQKGKYQVLTAGENRARRLDRGRPDGRCAGVLWIGALCLVLRRVHADHSCGAPAGADRCAVASRKRCGPC